MKFSSLLATISVLFFTQCLSGQTKIAFLVGVEQYEKKGFENLNYSEDDVTELDSVLKGLGFETKLLVGDPKSKQRATSTEIRKQISGWLVPKMKSLNKSDVLMVVLSGHGQQKLVKEREDVFFCPVDAHATDYSTWISVSELTKQISEESGCTNNLILFDACRNNPTKGTKEYIDGRKVQLYDNMSIFFAASYGQKAQELDRLQHGVFAYHILAGLRGAAADSEGELTWTDLVSYVQKKVSREQNVSQIPNLVSNHSGIITLAKNIKRSPERTEPEKSDNNGITTMPGDIASAAPGQIRPANSVGITMAWIPAGTFMMGSPGAADGGSNRKRQVSVTLTKGFWMGQTEVTQGQWASVMTKKPWEGKEGNQEGPDFPATYVSWDDANEFLNELNVREREIGKLPTDWSYRLPTEAQWEYACSAGSETRFSFGSDDSDLAQYAWFHTNTRDTEEKYAHEVGTKKANAYNLFDMHGNVGEWCRDVFTYRLVGGLDPESTSGGELREGSSGRSWRVNRGGNWTTNERNCESASRLRYPPELRSPYTGFRVALGP